MLSVGAVQPLTIAAPLGGTRMVDDCRLQADSLDDVLSVGAWASENRHGTCCARLDDFDWMVPPYDPDMILPGWEMYVEIPDVDRDICVLPDEVPVVVDKTVVEPLSLPVVVKTRPQVGCDPDLYLSERYVEVDIVDTRRDIRNLPGVVLAMFDGMAAIPITLPVDERRIHRLRRVRTWCGPDRTWLWVIRMSVAISR